MYCKFHLKSKVIIQNCTSTGDKDRVERDATLQAAKCNFHFMKVSNKFFRTR